MGKVDCVREAIENAKRDNSIEIATNCLKISNLSLEEISECTGLPLEKVMELKSNL
jgi:hypothetical protein